MVTVSTRAPARRQSDAQALMGFSFGPSIRVKPARSWWREAVQFPRPELAYCLRRAPQPLSEAAPPSGPYAACDSSKPWLMLTHVAPRVARRRFGVCAPCKIF